MQTAGSSAEFVECRVRRMASADDVYCYGYCDKVRKVNVGVRLCADCGKAPQTAQR